MISTYTSAGWSKYLTLAGTFQNCSSLRARAARNCSKSRYSLKKNFSLGICLGFSYFRPKTMLLSKKKVSTWNRSRMFENFVAAFRDRQDLNSVKLFSGPQKIKSRAAAWTTLYSTCV